MTDAQITPEAVERFNISSETDGYQSWIVSDPHPDGDWIRASDYDALAQLDQIRAEERAAGMRDGMQEAADLFPTGSRDGDLISAIFPNSISKNSRLGEVSAPFCAPKRDPILPLQERPNRRGELPVAVVICDRTGRGRPAYPGQSVVAVAARLGAVDWTSEPVGVRHG